MIVTVLKSELIGSVLIQLTEIMHSGEATYLLQAYRYKPVSSRCFTMHEVKYETGDRARALTHYNDWRIKTEASLIRLFLEIGDDCCIDLNLNEELAHEMKTLCADGQA